MRRALSFIYHFFLFSPFFSLFLSFLSFFLPFFSLFLCFLSFFFLSFFSFFFLLSSLCFFPFSNAYFPLLFLFIVFLSFLCIYVLAHSVFLPVCMFVLSLGNPFIINITYMSSFSVSLNILFLKLLLLFHVSLYLLGFSHFEITTIYFCNCSPSVCLSSSTVCISVSLFFVVFGSVFFYSPSLHGFVCCMGDFLFL